MSFFETDFGVILLWVIAGIILIPLIVSAIIAALVAVIFTIFKIVWIATKLAATVLIIAGIAYLILYFTGNLPIVI